MTLAVVSWPAMKMVMASLRKASRVMPGWEAMPETSDSSPPAAASTSAISPSTTRWMRRTSPRRSSPPSRGVQSGRPSTEVRSVLEIRAW